MKRFVAFVTMLAVLLVSMAAFPVMADETENPVKVRIKFDKEKVYYGETLNVTWTIENAEKPYVDFYACFDVMYERHEEGYETVWESIDENCEEYEKSFPIKDGMAGWFYVDVTDANGNTASAWKDIDFIDPNAVLVEEIVFDLDELVIEEGQSVKAPKTTIIPSNADDKTLLWSSGNYNVAHVFSDDGLVIGMAEGTTFIRAEAGDRGGAVSILNVRVVPKGQGVRKIALNRKKASLQVGEKLRLKAKLNPKDVYDEGLIWESSNEKVAVVNEKGRVEAVGEGKATITVTASSGKRAKCRITVTPALVKKITIEGKKTMKKGESQTLTAVIKPEYANDTRIKWRSSNKRIATVDKNGVVIARKKGNVVITAEARDGSGVKAVFKIKVKKK